jgi:5-methylcytosine-specific restriction protein B
MFADAPGTSGMDVHFRFKQKVEDHEVVLRLTGPGAVTAEMRQDFLETARLVGSTFAHHGTCGERKYHVHEVAEAVFDESIRDRLLTEGLEKRESEEGEVAMNSAFTPEALELLTAMAADPTKSFYAAHKDDLTQHVQEPLQGLLKEAAARIAPTLQDALETTKKLFGVFPKNDWGKGGAWPYYWGAFYPQGGKKTDGCQLYVFLDEKGFSYGFSIGSYASQDRKRFAQNAEEYRGAIVAALGETVNAPDFEFGHEDESAAGEITQDVEGLDLAGWLEQDNKVEPHVHVLLPWDELLEIERERVISDVVDAFNRLFPLVLLGTMDEPMPAIRAYMEGDIEEEEEIEVNPPYSLDDLVAETSLPKENLEAWLRAIDRKGQAILYGPPGTGKTYVAERLAKHLVAGGTGTAELVQFHPAYAYEDFMQGMRPKARDGGGLDYPIMDGRFKQFCDQARGRDGLSVLIIDEVNRANLARVFGELMYLLEYRDKSIPLAAGGRFSIPANVRLIGTMNTADRSIALVDHALRRRFAFLPLYPDYRMLTDYHAKNGGGYDPAKLVEVLKDLNRKIGDHHYEVGTSFFMRPDIADQLPDVWSMEIEPYLEEYFFDQRATVDSFRWGEVKKKLGME